ncbi:MAG TPA: glycosyltransferase family 39 protein [Thermoanaerobaculia bacterium]|nr:glycosyltransferase family 39 protein [Thermoanaerobaculia bacterium]
MSRRRASAPRWRRLEALLVGAALALFAWRELAALRADGTTADEQAHLAYGMRGLASGTFEREDLMLNSKMPVSVLNALPVAAAGRLGWSLGSESRIQLGRLPTVALGLVLGWLVWHWARALFGFGGGVLSLFLYSFCPNVLAHSHLVTTDLATALGMFAATYAFWRYRQRPGGRRLAVAAAAFGAAQLTKVTALFLVPIFLLIVLCELLRRRLGRARLAAGGSAEGAAAAGADSTVQGPAGARTGPTAEPIAGGGQGPARTAVPGGRPGRADHGTPRRILGALSPAAALLAGAVVALNLGFAGEKTLARLSDYAPVSRPFQALAAAPLLRDVPIPVPLPYVTGLDMVAHDVRAGTLSYLHGRFSAHGFWDYYLVAMLIKTPSGTLGLLLLAAWLAATGRVRVAGAEAFLLVPPAFLLAYLSFAFELQIGLRYLLPALPFLFVFAGRAAAWRPAASPFGIAVSVLAAWTAASSLASHPRYIPYFNELIGGQRNGYRWLTDSNVDWGQDNRYVRDVYARHSPVRVWVEPGGPIAGRVAVGFATLVPRHAWLRDHFQPLALIHGSWAVYDVTAEQIERCCADLPQAWTVPGGDGNLAPAGQPIGGSGGGVRFLERLNDGMLGGNSDWDAARSAPATVPVEAWFGIEWGRPQRIGRVAAYPGWLSRGPAARRYLALDYVLQWWDGRAWIDLPGTRVTGNRRVHVEHSFPPVSTTRLRLLIERERNNQGTETVPGAFRAACLEIAAWPS